MHRFLIFIALIVVATVQDGIAVSVPLPQTGQTECFNDTGISVPCAGTGQDGEFKAGVPLPSPRFTLKSGLLTDRLTGLMWPEDANVVASDALAVQSLPSGAVTWERALEYVKKMNQQPQGYMGYSDWRLPNVNELESLINQTADLPSSADYLWDYFWHLSNGQQYAGVHDNYWSSTTLVGTETAPLQAWVANLQTGAVSNFGKTNTAYLLPVRDVGVTAAAPVLQTGQAQCFGNVSCTEQDGVVRAGLSWDAGRFSKTGGTVADLMTDLVWVADTANPAVSECGSPVGRSWEESLAYVRCLNMNAYAGQSDWRLPNRKELASIAVNGSDDNVVFLEQFGFIFPDEAGRAYWTSSSNLVDPLAAWAVTLDRGGANVQKAGKLKPGNAWPVRGGRVGVALPSLAPETIDFGTVETMESSQPVVVTLANSHMAGNKLVVNEIAVSDEASFTVVPGGASACASLAPVLAPGQSCTLLITFHPQSTGEKPAELRAFFAGDVGARVASVTGKGKDTRLWITIADNVTSFTTKNRTQQISGTIDVGATLTVTVPGRQPLPVRYERGKWFCAIDQLKPGINEATVVATDGTNTTEPLKVTIAYQPFLISSAVETEGGSIVALDPVPANQGDPVAVPYKGKASFSIVPLFGFHVEKVVLDGKKSIGKRTAYTFTNVKSDRSISARFARNIYSIKTASGKGGAVTRSFKALYEDTPSITVTPKDGYEIASVADVSGPVPTVLYDVANPTALEPDGTLVYRFSAISANHRIKATFRKRPLLATAER